MTSYESYDAIKAALSTMTPAWTLSGEDIAELQQQKIEWSANATSAEQLVAADYKDAADYLTDISSAEARYEAAQSGYVSTPFFGTTSPEVVTDAMQSWLSTTMSEARHSLLIVNFAGLGNLEFGADTVVNGSEDLENQDHIGYQNLMFEARAETARADLAYTTAQIQKLFDVDGSLFETVDGEAQYGDFTISLDGMLLYGATNGNLITYNEDGTQSVDYYG